MTVDADYTIGQIVGVDTVDGSGAADGFLITGSGILTLSNGLNKPVISSNNTFTEPGGTAPFGGPLRISAVLAGSNGFEKTGPGYLSLEAANTFNGNVKLTAPSTGGGNFLRLTNDNNLGASGNDIEIAANAQAVGLYASTGFTVTLNSGRNIITSSASGTQDFWIKTKGTGNIVIEGVISGGTRLRKNDSGIATLSGANTFTGNTFIEGGTLVLTGGDNRLASGSVITMGGATTGTTLTINGGNQTVSNLALTTPTSAVTQTISGTGGLIIQGTGNFGISANVTTTSLNMGNMTHFTLTRPAADFSVIATNASVVNTVNLAKLGTNAISANRVFIGGGGANAAGQLSNVGLGQNNEFNVGDEFVIGNFQGSGNVTFQSGLTAPVLKIRGAAGGTSAAPAVRIGRTNSGNQPSSGILNLSGGSLDVIATQLDVAAHNASAATAATGTLTMPAGTVEAATLSVARKTNTTGTPIITGTFNQSGGTVTADTVYLGNNEGSTAVTFSANYNLNGGTLLAGTVGANGATFGASSVRNLNFNGGTLRNKAGGNLSVSGFDTTSAGRLNLVVGSLNGTIEADAGRMVTLADTVRLSGAGTLNKAGEGTLVINADSTAFTGGLTHSAGALELGAVDSVSTFTAGSFTWNGGTLNFDLSGASSSDKISLGSGVFTRGSGAASSFIFDFGGGGVAGGEYTLASFGSFGGSFAFSISNLATDLTGTLAIRELGAVDDLVLTVAAAIPEPSSFGVFAGLGALGFLAGRRRRS